MIRVDSTVPAYVDLLEVPGGAARVQAWTAQYEAAHESVFAVYYRSWGDRGQRAQAAASVERMAPLVLEREGRAGRLANWVAVELELLGFVHACDWRVVLLVGGGSSNGWTAMLNGHQTLFLALEVLPEPPFDEILVLHEALHIAHDADEWPENVLSNLWREGVAVALSRWMRPGLTDSAYLWFDARHDGWVTQCRVRRDEITRLVKANLAGSDEVLVRQLFSLPPGSAVPPRCGYWLGDQIISALLEDGHSPRELLHLGYHEALSRALL